MTSIFSRIASGDIPAQFIFNDEHWFGILDLYPVSPGHVLVVPHHETALVTDLPADTLAAMGDRIARMSAAIVKAVGCDAVSILIRDGVAAGQEIPHVHIHLIPRFNGDEPHDFAGGRYGHDEGMVQSAMADMHNKISAAWA